MVDSDWKRMRERIEAGITRQDCAAAAAARRRTQCARLRAVGARSDARPTPVCGSWRASRTARPLTTTSPSAPTILQSWPQRRDDYAHARASSSSSPANSTLDIERVRRSAPRGRTSGSASMRTRAYTPDTLDAAAARAGRRTTSRCSSSPCRAAAKPISTASTAPIPIAADESVQGLAGHRRPASAGSMSSTSSSTSAAA